MISEIRKNAPGPWILLPTLMAGTAGTFATWAFESWPLGLAAGAACAVAAAWWTEWRLRSVVGGIGAIASGDRYAALPRRIGRGPMADIAAAAERMRQSLIDFDALAVDHRSREAETRLHQAGRTFFTQRFRHTVEELTLAFEAAGEEIRVTAADLGARNQDMRAHTTSAADAAESAGRDV